MKHIAVVGSGASGVHFALTALQAGHRVTLLDVGGERPAPVRADTSFDGLKDVLEDPVSHFLGPSLSGVVYPGSRDTFYGFPPTKDYVFATPQRFSYRTAEMKPWFTFARGGFAETWTAGVYTFDNTDLRTFPFGFDALRDAYAEVADRIGICGVRDDLERFMPFPAEYLAPLPLDAHSSSLLQTYERRRGALQRMGWHMGRSRVATLSRNYGDRAACAGLGRCLLGCPTESIYTPTATLRTCLSYAHFEYVPHTFVTHFDIRPDGQVRAIVGERMTDGERVELCADEYALAAGTLLTSKIVLDSIYRATGRVVKLPGLMDNRQIHVPFLSLRMIGRPAATASYQFHHLAFGLTAANEADDYVHGQITTLKSASVHPIVQNLPVDLKSGLDMFRSIRAGLAVANVNLSDSRRPESYITIEPLNGGGETRLVIAYESAADEPERVKRAVTRVKNAIMRLGGIVPPGLTRVLPKGTSVHYAGTIPMSTTRAPLHCSPECRSYDFPNLLLVDGVSFPGLPAKNHTFTLMANAVRVARSAL